MTTSRYERTAQRARSRALRALAQLHPEDFARLNAEERRVEGLDPPDMTRWNTAVQLSDGEIRSLYESGLSLKSVGGRLGVSSETIRRRLRAAGCDVRPARRPARSGRQP